MRPHIREALALAGLRPSEVEITRSGAHFKIHLHGVGGYALASSTPQCATAAARYIARDLLKLMRTAA